ncbi:hypothetical protein HK104_001120, partial [Borealophlyctis nickersoniae]
MQILTPRRKSISASEHSTSSTASGGVTLTESSVGETGRGKGVEARRGSTSIVEWVKDAVHKIPPIHPAPSLISCFLDPPPTPTSPPSDPLTIKSLRTGTSRLTTAWAPYAAIGKWVVGIARWDDPWKSIGLAM